MGTKLQNNSSIEPPSMMTGKVRVAGSTEECWNLYKLWVISDQNMSLCPCDFFIVSVQEGAD